MQHDCEYKNIIIESCKEVAAMKAIVSSTDATVKEIKLNIKEFLQARTTVALSLVGLILTVILASYSFAIEYGVLQNRTTAIERTLNITK